MPPWLTIAPGPSWRGRIAALRRRPADPGARPAWLVFWPPDGHDENDDGGDEQRHGNHDQQISHAYPLVPLRRGWSIGRISMAPFNVTAFAGPGSQRASCPAGNPAGLGRGHPSSLVHHPGVGERATQTHSTATVSQVTSSTSTRNRSYVSTARRSRVSSFAPAAFAVKPTRAS